jgi:hypothetical protein
MVFNATFNNISAISWERVSDFSISLNKILKRFLDQFHFAKYKTNILIFMSFDKVIYYHKKSLKIQQMIRNRTLKYRQFNGRKKKHKKTNNDQQNTSQTSKKSL